MSASGGARPNSRAPRGGPPAPPAAPPRRPAPAPARPPKGGGTQSPSPRRRGGPGGPGGARGRPLEGGETKSLARRAQGVAGGPLSDRAGRPRRAGEPRALPLHLRPRRDRRAAGVEVVREPLDRDDAVRVQQQD